MTSKASRPYDIIVYGATGFTGQRIATHIHKYHSSKIKLAIAGRNITKLHQFASSINLPHEHTFPCSLTTNNNNNNDDTNREQLIHALSQSRIVLACAGPYSDPTVGCTELVRAAIEAGTDYLDICGEPAFFEEILAEFDGEARAKGVLVISACAFDCVPAELSAKMVAREMRRRQMLTDATMDDSTNTDGGASTSAAAGDNTVVSGIEIVHTMENGSTANATTFHAAVDGFYAACNGDLTLKRARVKEVHTIPPPSPRPKTWPTLPNKPGTAPVYHPRTGTYTLKFIGADAACMIASDRYLRLRNGTTDGVSPPPRLSVCFGVPRKSDAYKVIAYGAVFSSLARYQWGCKLLHSKPSLFSNGIFHNDGIGPTQDELDAASFTTYSTAYGRTKDEVVYGTCSGGEPGYVATPKILVALGLTVLRFRDKLTFEAGVMLPGAAFGECEEVYTALREEGIQIDIVPKEEVVGHSGQDMV